MPRDFVNLGFTPESQLERVRQVPRHPHLAPTPHSAHNSPVISRVRQSNLTEGLSFVLRQLSQGGGGKKITERVRAEWREKYDPDGTLSPDELRQKVREEFIEQGRAQLEAEGVENVNVMEVQNVMEQMQQRNRELFKVPPYILYVARAFSTLEGIGLSANDDYSIVSEAFPYLSQRLLTDESPRAKAALRSMVYGTSEESAVNEKTPSLSKLVSIGGSAHLCHYATAFPLRIGRGASHVQKWSGGDIMCIPDEAVSNLHLIVHFEQLSRTYEIVVVGRSGARVDGYDYGAGAVVLEKSPQGELLGQDFGVNGDLESILYCDLGDTIVMEGREVFKRAVRAVTDSVENALAQAGISAEDIDVVLPHQANIRIIEAVTQRLGIPMEKTFNVLEHTGNTSGASIPMAMAAANEAGVLKPGAVVLMSGFGAGMAWGSVVVRW